MKAVNHIDMQKLEIRFGVLHPLAAAPASPATGQGYYDTVLLAPRFFDGSVWGNKASDSLLLGGQNLAYTLARANATGTQIASTISDLATVVKAYRLDEFAVPTADVAFNGRKITGLADPTTAQDAATMNYVQSQVASAAAGIDSKPSVRIATTVNDTLSGLAARDGVTPVAGDRVLAKNQTTASANGVYIAAAGAWTRATPEDTSAEMTPGAFWFVEEGTTNALTQWRLANSGAIVLGTTALTITQFGAANTYTNGNGLALAGNVFSVTPKASGGIVVDGTGVSVDTTIVARKASGLIGDGSTQNPTFTHNLGTKDVTVIVREVATDLVVLADVTMTNTNTVTIGFATAPAANSYRVTVIG